MSRKYNVTARLLSAYNKYVTEFQKKSTAWAKRGYAPVDNTTLSYEDYVAQRGFLKARGVAAGNITKKIISMQFYEMNEASAQRIMLDLKLLGIETLDGEKITIEKLKRGLGKRALSVINEALKQHGYAGGYERAQWITEHIYEDSL